MTSLLDVRDLRVTFQTRMGIARAVDGVSFRIDAGESVALVGESGCGKTVTALAILRLITPPGRIDPASEMLFDGQNVMQLGGEALRQLRGPRIGISFADALGAFDPIRPIGVQIAETIFAHETTSHADAWRRAITMLDRTGLADPDRAAAALPSQLSGGQRQRAALAMALVLRPSLLIADEPTSALDTTTQAQVLDLLRELRRELGTALLLITHDLGVVAAVTDRAMVMYAGQIIEEAPSQALLTTPKHPYTAGLLAARPQLGADNASISAIPGIVPAATDWPAACRFHDRCALAWDLCATDAPPLARIDDSRTARCHLVTHTRPS